MALLCADEQRQPNCDRVFQAALRKQFDLQTRRSSTYENELPPHLQAVCNLDYAAAAESRRHVVRQNERIFKVAVALAPHSTFFALADERAIDASRLNTPPAIEIAMKSNLKMQI